MIKKEVISKDKALKNGLKSNIEFKEWDDIGIEQGIQLTGYFNTLIAMIYQSHFYVDRGVSKIETLKDIPDVGFADFMLSFLELPERELKTIIRIHTWVLSTNDSSIKELLVSLAKKNGRSVSIDNISIEEFYAMIDCFTDLMVEAKSSLNFTVL
jgi:hypothetical protein